MYLFKKIPNSYLALLLVAIGFVLYVNSFQNLMFWDDNDGIINNLYIKDWQYFTNYFSENLIAGANLVSNYWRPMLLSVFSIEWHIWGGWPTGYHIVNTSFHVADAVLLFFILFYIFKNRLLAILTALLFLAHPLQTEAVTYVSGLGDPLSVFFMFLGILFYLKFRISKKTPEDSALYLLSLPMYLFALMSKETAIVMPALIFVADFFFLNGERGELSFKEKIKEAGKAIWPFFVIAVIYVLMRGTILNFSNTFNLYDEVNLYTSNLHIRLFTFFRVLATYFSLIFWPIGLHMERSVELATSLFSLPVIFGGVISLGLLAIAFCQTKRFPILSFGIFWFFIGLSPTSNLLVPINGLIYEHWLYLPAIGIFLILIWLGMRLAEKYDIKKILLAFLAIFLVFLSTLTIRRNMEWRDPVTFYNQTLKYAANNYRITNNLGMAYDDRADYEQAEKMYKRSIGLDPSNPIAYHNLGNTYKKIGKLDLAIENFNIAIRLNPNFVFSYRALTALYLENKNYQEARKVLEKHLGQNDFKIDILTLLARISMEEKNPDAALGYLEKALKIEPGNRFVQSFIISVKDMRTLNMRSE